MLFEDFVRKYRCIAFDSPKLLAPSLDQAEVVVNLLERAGLGRDGPHGWAQTKIVQVGRSKVFLKNETLPILDKPRRLARMKATVVVQACARRRLARRVRHFVRVHRFRFDSVRHALDRPDPDQKAATIEARIGDVGLVLDELIEVHDQSALPMSIALVLTRCAHAKDALELELRALAHGLDGEVAACAELTRVIHAEGTGTSKESFMALKVATAAAHEASEDLTEEVRRRRAEVEWPWNGDTLPAPCSLLSARCSLLAALCSLLAARCSLLPAPCSLLLHTLRPD